MTRNRKDSLLTTALVPLKVVGVGARLFRHGTKMRTDLERTV